MTPPWFRPLSLFCLFNLIAVPIIGHIAWDGMLRLNSEAGPIAAVGVSLVVSAGILVGNILLFRAARAADLPRPGQMVLFVLIGLTFVLPIGTGRFSPINLMVDLLR
ncbi:MAG: hypothetical protein AAGA26_07020 [Pseudomonadota bacterium]